MSTKVTNKSGELISHQPACCRASVDPSRPLDVERLSVADVHAATRLSQPDARRLLWQTLAPHAQQLTGLLLDGALGGQPAVTDALLSDALDQASDFADNLPVILWLAEAIGERALMLWGRQDENRQRSTIAEMLPRFDDHGRRTGPPTMSAPACTESAARQFRAAIELLPPLYRMTLVLADVYGVPRSHLAEMLARDEAATRLVLHHARLAVTETLLSMHTDS